MQIYFVRHGRPAVSRQTCIGWLDVPLHEDAFAEAENLRSTWNGRPPDRLVTSDLLRARQTAYRLNEVWHCQVESEDRLREMNFGRWEGQDWADIQVNDADHLQRWMDDWVSEPPPGGESFFQMRMRVMKWLDEAWESDAETIVVVAHSGTIRAVLSAALGLPVTKAFRIRTDLLGVSLLERKPGEEEIEVGSVNVPMFT